MRRSASFTGRPLSETRTSRIPTLQSPTTPSAPRRNLALEPDSPSVLRRSGSLRLPSARGSPAPEREVWGVGSGSWGKRQQQLRRQGQGAAPGDPTGRPKPTTPLSNRGSNTSIDRLHLGLSSHRRPYEDDDDLCSELSYDSTMSVDRTSSRRYVVHCSSDHLGQTNGKQYLTPTQRTTLLNKELKARLKQAMDEVTMRDMEISRLTQECVELRMKQARLSASPDVSSTPPGMEKDSLNSSVHSELPLESVSISVISEEEPPRLKGRPERLTPPQMHLPQTPEEEAPIISPTTPFPDPPEELKAQVVKPQYTPPPRLENGYGGTSPSDGRVSQDNLNESGVFSGSPSLEAHLARLVVSSPEQRRPMGDPARPARPDILNLNFDEEGRGQPDNCLFNNLPVVMQVPVWREEEAKKAEVAVMSRSPEVSGVDCPAPAKFYKEAEIQTEPDEMEVQLKAAQEALIETKVQLSRLRSAAESSQAEVTLKFLKSAFYHLVTDSSQGMSLATKSHWRAIQSILGFSPDECHAMDSAVAAGSFPGSTW